MIPVWHKEVSVRNKCLCTKFNVKIVFVRNKTDKNYSISLEPPMNDSELEIISSSLNIFFKLLC